MKNMKDFAKKKAEILKEYESFKSAAFLPINYQDVVFNNATIEKDIENLENERFIVSVCGQVKVGKSTLLNAMVFERDILPNAATPETAKLIEITWGEVPAYEIDFYTKKEWDRLCNETIQEIDRNGREVKYSYYEKNILPILQKLQGTYGETFYEEILNTETICGNDLEDLKKYVSAKGRYTIFVKRCRIKYPAEILREITIVDTPGTNDPNPIRSLETEKWVGKSDAVVFIMYAGQALTVQDKEFIENYLLPVPTDKIMLALSKLDTVKDGSRVQEFVEQALKGMESFHRNIRNKRVYGIVPICSLYPKLRNLHKEGRCKLREDVLEDIEYQLDDRRQELEQYLGNEGGIPAFTVAVVEQLLQNKAEALLDSHIQKIIAVYEYRLRSLKINLAKYEKEVEYLSLNAKELKEENFKLEEARGQLNSINNDWKASMKSLSGKTKDKIYDRIVDMLKQVKNKSESYIVANTVEHLHNNLQWELKNFLEQEQATLSKGITNQFDQYKDSVSDIKTRIITQIKNMNIFIPSMIDDMLNVPSLWQINKELEEMIIEKLSSEKLMAMRKSFFIGIGTDVKETKARYTKEINELCMSNSGFREKFNYIFENEIGNIQRVAESVSGELTKAIVDMQTNINKIKDNKILQGQKSQELSEQLDMIRKDIKITHEMKHKIELKFKPL